MPEPKEFIWRASISSSNLPNLGTLRLLNSKASVKTLSAIPAITPNLHTLEYNFVQGLGKVIFGEFYNERHYDEWADFTSALTQVQDTLRDLTISLAYYCCEGSDVQELDLEWVDRLWERRGYMGSLRSFSKLERLEIPLPVLLGWNPDFSCKKLRDVLPSSLKELCLRDDLVDMYKGCTYPWTPGIQILMSGLTT